MESLKVGENRLPKGSESDAMEDAWGYALNNVLQYPARDEESDDYTNALAHYMDDHPDVDFEPDDVQKFSKSVFESVDFGDKGHLIVSSKNTLEAIEPEK